MTAASIWIQDLCKLAIIIGQVVLTISYVGRSTIEFVLPHMMRFVSEVVAILSGRRTVSGIMISVTTVGWVRASYYGLKQKDGCNSLSFYGDWWVDCQDYQAAIYKPPEFIPLVIAGHQGNPGWVPKLSRNWALHLKECGSKWQNPIMIQPIAKGKQTYPKFLGGGGSANPQIPQNICSECDQWNHPITLGLSEVGAPLDRGLHGNNDANSPV